MKSLSYCKRCMRLFITEELHDDGMCNTCYSGAMPQWAFDLARELRALPPEADLFSWAQHILRAVYIKENPSEH